MFDSMLRGFGLLEGTGTMGTIHEFPQWRAQRSQAAASGRDAQVVIFPGVRIERDDAQSQPAPQHDGPANSSSDSGRQTRKSGKP